MLLLKNGSTGKAVEKLQTDLNRLGASLTVDGEFGDATYNAVRAFQARHSLEVDGKAGDETLQAIEAAIADGGSNVDPPSPPSVLDAAPWLTVMRAITGTREFPGGKNNPLILQWAREIADEYPDLKGDVNWYTNDAIPWCGLTVGHCMAATGQKPPSGLLGAINWGRAWADGKTLPRPTSRAFVPGCVMVFSRTGGNHVALLERMESDDVAVIRGGNQSDMVNTMRMSMARWRYATWPKDVPVPTAVSASGRKTTKRKRKS